MKLDTYLCPGCGDEVPIGPRGCPKCSRPPKPRKKVPRPSWEQDKYLDDLDLRNEDFDYDEYVAREFGKAPHRKIGLKWYWWVTALVIVILMILGAFRIGGFL